MTLSTQSWLTLLQQNRTIAVIRTSNQSIGRKMAQAVAAAGITVIEITWNTDAAAELIPQLRQELPNCTIGTGTILNLEQIHQAIDVGAEFLFTPHTNTTLIHTATQVDVPIIPGALSPSEIMTAWDAGASCVKVFPIQAVGGVNYIKALQGPLGHIPLIPTGGVTFANAKDFIQAGAIAIGLAGDLFPQTLIASEDWQGITQRAKKLRSQFRHDL